MRLEIKERKRFLEVTELNNGRDALLAGTHHYSTRSTIELSKHTEAAGADALLILPPYYLAPTAEQTMGHYRRIASAVELPIIFTTVFRWHVSIWRTDQLLALYQERVIDVVKM